MSSTVSLSVTLTHVQKQIVRYVYSLYMLFGVTGACLNIILFSRRQFRTSSCCIYFLSMSAGMLVNLLVGLGLPLNALNNVDPTILLLPICKMRLYILQASAMTYRWSLTAACFDRFASSDANPNLRHFAQVHIARRVIAVIIIAWLILPIHIPIFNDIQGPVCGFVYSSAAALYHSIFTTIMGAVLPSTIMIICAILLHKNIRFKRQRRPLHFNRINLNSNVQNKRDHQVLTMLLVQVLIYLILILPLMSVYFYNGITLNIPNKSADRLAIERFVLFSGESILLIYPVSSFYIHTMASNLLRTEIMNIIRQLFMCRKPTNRVHILATTNASQTMTITGNISIAKTVIQVR